MPHLESSRNGKLASFARAQTGLITLEQASKAGLTVRQCNRLVATGRWEQVARGLYRVAGVAESWEHRVWAACLATRGWASHRTAGWLHGLDGLGRAPPRELEVVVEYRSNRRSPDARVRRSRTLSPSHLSKAAGIPRTNLPRTLIDLAEVLDAKSLELAFDSALRRVADLRPWLRRLLGAMPANGHRGIASLAVLLDDTERAVDSALEVKLRRLLKTARLPAPLTGLDVVEDGVHVANVDFAWPHNKPRVALMAHGNRYHANTWRWRRDLEQATQLTALGWRVLQCSMDDLTQRPAKLVLSVRRALAGFEAAAQLHHFLEH